MNLVELQAVRKYFPGKAGRGVVRAVDGVDLAVRPGEHLGLVGESGSGKTTLGRMIVRLYTADQGRILWNGRDVTRLSSGALRPLRPQVQMVFQDPFSSLDPRFTVRRLLGEAHALAFPKEKREAREARAGEMLKAVGLGPEVMGRFPHEFSGGERQRIAIARALMMNPRLLILDEAVSALDILIQRQIIDLLRDLQEQFSVTYIFISHNLRVVRRLCARTAVMYRGRIVESAPVEKIFSEARHPYTQALLSAAIDYKAVGGEDIILPAEGALTDVGSGHFVLKG